MAFPYLLPIFCLAACTTAAAASPQAACSPADAARPYYTVQILAAPAENQCALRRAYRSLCDQGHLAYYSPARVGARSYLRLRVGLFEDRARAQSYADHFTKAEARAPFIARTRVFVDSFRDRFGVVTTPSGIWYRAAGRAKELYHFQPVLERAPDCPARISPGGKHIAFCHDNRIMTLDLGTGRATTLQQGTKPDEFLHSVVRWSPDGRHIAYLDAVAWELPSRLWVLRSDGTDNRCLAGDETGRTKVKSFLWHPHENKLFYVAGPTHGTVSVGGSLYVTDLEGNRRSLAPGDPSSLHEVASDFRIVGNTLYYRIVSFDKNGQVRGYTLHDYSIDDDD
jgi:hypothetical protein